MTRRAGVAIALGGAVGATLRWSVLAAVGSSNGFPWAVFALNVAGSLLLGLAVAFAHGRRTAVWWRDAVGIGFCGGLTTFSTFAVESATFVRDGHAGLAAVYVSSSVVAAVLAVWAGAAIVGRPRAVDDPLEAAA